MQEFWKIQKMIIVYIRKYREKIDHLKEKINLIDNLKNPRYY